MHSASNLLAVAICLAPFALYAQSADLPTLSFATIEQGRELLTTRDDFVMRLSLFDRAARLKTDKDVSEEEYLRFVAASVREWHPEEKAAVESAWSGLAARVAEMRLPLPKTISFVKTSGAEEGDAEYTRGTAIMLPESALQPARRAGLKAIVAHACATEANYALAEMEQLNGRALGALINDHGVKLAAFPDDLIAAARKQSVDVLGELGQRSAIAGKVHDSYTEFRARNAPWSRISIESVLRARA